MTEQKFLSFNPDDATAGGNLNDIDATIVQARVVSFDYNGKADEPLCCLALTYLPDGAEDKDDVIVDYIKLGKMTECAPAPDNKRAVPISKSSFHTKSKIMAYFRAAVAAGVPKNQLAQDVSVLDNLRVHLTTIEIAGEGTDKSGQKIKDSKLTFISKLLDSKAPAVKAGTGAKAKAAAAKTEAPAAAPAAAAAPEGVEDEAINQVLAILGDKNGKVAKSALPGEMFRRIKDTATRNAVIKLVGNTEWLDGEKPWKFEGGELSIG
jgi:hypothetical protein